MKKFIAKIVLFGFLFVLSLELCFRTFIPAPDKIQSVRDEEFGIDYYAEQERNKDFIFSYGKRAQILNRELHINNAGWHNGKDYLPKEKRTGKKLLAVIGDSYIENKYCHWSDHFSSLLEKEIGSEYEVYTFGRDGSSLAQYINMSRYVHHYYKPDYIIYFTRDRSLDKSIIENGRISQILQFGIDEAGSIESHDPVKPQTKAYQKWITKNISIYRYFATNFKMKVRNPLVIKKKEKKEEIDIKEQKAIELRRNRIAEKVISEIQAVNDTIPFMFLNDGDRTYIYGEKEEYSQPEYEIIKKIAKGKGIETLNLTAAFTEEYKKNHKEFEYEINYHLNEYGNTIVAKALTDFLPEQLSKVK